MEELLQQLVELENKCAQAFNRKDIDEIEKSYIADLKIHYVEHVDEVISIALMKEKVPDPMKSSIILTMSSNRPGTIQITSGSALNQVNCLFAYLRVSVWRRRSDSSRSQIPSKYFIMCLYPRDIIGFRCGE